VNDPEYTLGGNKSAHIIFDPAPGVSWITMLNPEINAASVGTHVLLAAPPQTPLPSHTTPGQFSSIASTTPGLAGFW
jgi:hypothetical protein